MPKDKPATAVRGKAFHVRMDAALFTDAMARAGEYGLGPVIRALLRAYIRGDIDLKADDLLKELASAPKGPTPHQKPRKRPDTPKT